MRPRASDIDRLLEEGLARYGQGDLDVALELWERVLALDPGNTQASSYVDYVRQNYDLLRGEEVTKDGEDASGPFAIGAGEPDYQIEITEGELPSAGRAFVLRPTLDALDEGWALDDEPTRGTPAVRTISADLPPPPDAPLELEIEAEPPDADPGFDDATREYWKGRPPTRDLKLAGPEVFENPDLATQEFGAEVGRQHRTPGFGTPQDVHTPTEFGQQLTGVRKRELGFVKPTGATTLTGTGTAGPMPAKNVVRAKRASVVPELKMTLRTPELPPPDDLVPGLGLGSTPARPTIMAAPPPVAPAPPTPSPAALAALAPLSGTTKDLPAPSVIPAAAPNPRDALDLELDEAFRDPSVPTLPAVARAVPQISHEMPAITLEPTPSSDPQITVVPSSSDPQITLERAGGSDPAVAPPGLVIEELPVAPTLTLGAAGAGRPRNPTDDDDDAAEADLFGADRETADLPRAAIRAIALELGDAGRVPDPLPPRAPLPPSITSLPTRDLGIRPGAGHVRLPTEEETTSQTAIPRPPSAEPATSRADTIAEPRDAAETMTQLILAAVDRDAPESETPDDRTRRRITGLLERAQQWGAAGDGEKAVSAVDLALEQDPTSAIAQKLIHRHRDAIQGVYQGYLGDLQRQPTLACSMAELANASIGPRAAFLLSRIDGMLSVDEILDVSGMPRLEAYRHLSQLFLRGILK